MENEPSARPCIRDATVGDLDTIVEFNRLLARESESLELNPRAIAGGVREVLLRPELGRYFLAELDGQIVGQTMLTYEWSDWRNGMFWWIQSVYVVSEHRCRGVFRALFEHITSLARSSRA